MYIFFRSPPTSCQDRSRPSRVKPALSAERSEAVLHGSTYSSRRGILRVVCAHTLTLVTIFAAQPFPRAERTIQYPIDARPRSMSRSHRPMLPTALELVSSITANE